MSRRRDEENTLDLRTRLGHSVDHEDVDGWLSGATGLEVLKPASEELLTARPVSKRVNKVGNTDDASLAEAVPAESVLP